MVVGRRLRVQLVELVLGEVADVDALGAKDVAARALELAGDQLGERRLAVAVLAEQRDAVVLVDAQVEVLQHRAVRLHSRRRPPPAAAAGWPAAFAGCGRWKGATRSSICAAIGCILRQRLDAALRLRGLGRLGLEAVDERLDAAALLVLLLLELQFEPLLGAARFLEVVVAAGVERELAAIQVQDRADRAVQQVAVVADDQDRVRDRCLQIAFEPHGAFQVEIVGGLVEQQDLGLEEQHGGERHAHAPAAGQRAAGPVLGRLVEAEAGEDLGGARGRRMRVDVGEPLVDVGDAVRVLGVLGLCKQARALGVGGEHPVDEAVLAARRLLRDVADAR